MTSFRTRDPKPKLDYRLSLLTPSGPADPTLAIAASRAGALGTLNLEFCAAAGQISSALEALDAHARNPYAVLVDGSDPPTLELVLQRPGELLAGVVVTAGGGAALDGAAGQVHRSGRPAWAVVTSLEEALEAQGAGFDAVVCKGNEAGGWVGEETAFVLFQRLLPKLTIPIHVQGGIGLSTAAACIGAGAAGVVLDSQLLLLKESPLAPRERQRVEAMDGSETQLLGASLGRPCRVYGRGDEVAALEKLEAEAASRTGSYSAKRKKWTTLVGAKVDWRGEALWPLGQDAAFASRLAKQFVTVGGLVAGLTASVRDYCLTAAETDPLGEGSSLAQAHRTRFPIVQGPMTRVSDRAEFASAVASEGALPFLALALMRSDEAGPLLERTKELLGSRSWGVGILGFVPPGLRSEQLELIRKVQPPFALIAGGQPYQARELEADGIPTYLHVPSPGLLEMFLADGARRFVFEGRECGGHVGPRTSFVLWESMIAVLAAHLDRHGEADPCQVLFAGGVNDSLSAQMVSIMAAPLVERGVKIGVLLGTAYLFTREAVQTGAIQSRFQQAALDCTQTVTLAATPGYATRCAPNPFCDAFEEEKRRLLLSGIEPQELKERLEELNIGRLRIASKGMDHNPDYGRVPGAQRTVAVEEQRQWAAGMYMIGQVAALRDAPTTLAELHREVSQGASERLGEMRIAAPQESRTPEQANVAIVGMASILPGAADLSQYWDNILDKVDAVTEVPRSRWDVDEYFDPDAGATDRVHSKWGGFIEEVAFDPLSWGMPPNSLRSIEPFQLLALEVVRRAIDDAGYSERAFPKDNTSVMLGAGGGAPDLTAGYVVRSSLPGLFGREAADGLTRRLEGVLPEWTEDSFAGLLMNVAAGRVANRFDFGGVNYTVDAACASSLAAVYLAVRDLQAGTSDVAIAGGVEGIQNPFDFFCFGETRALSPTGRSKPFDQNADGIAISEGFAALVLKRLEDAERDGDRIYAVIKGVGGSSDGRDKGLTAPRPEGQMRAFRRAYQQAGLSPATVGLIEAHGTGTVAGDRAELQSLVEMFNGAATGPRQVAVGSVKSMIGHTKATAGVASLIKTAKALHHKILPPTLGVSRPNGSIDHPTSPIYVNTEARPWVQGSADPRRAGVSAFGFGGTNFHVVLEEYADGYLDAAASGRQTWPAELFLLTGESPADLAEQVDRLIELLAAGARPSLVDLSYTLSEAAQSRGQGAEKLAIVAGSLTELDEKLRRASRLIGGTGDRQHDGGIHYARQGEGRTALAALFPGQGSQSVNMGRELALVWPGVREVFDRADRILAETLDAPISRRIFPPPAFTPEQEEADRQALTATEVAQPALGATELAMLAGLKALGFDPAFVAGHSYGELVALHAAGVFSEEDLLQLSAARGAAMAQASSVAGGMAAVGAGPQELEALVGEVDVVLANLNSPRQTVVSGSVTAIDAALDWCRANGLTAKRLPVARAFHSPFVAGARESFAGALKEVELHPPARSVYSNTTAGLYPKDRRSVRRRLAGQLAKPVDFVGQIESMYRDGARVFVEVGPGRVLSGLVDQILGDRPHLAVPIAAPGSDGLTSFLDGCAALLAEGCELSTAPLFEGRAVQLLDLSAPPETLGAPSIPPTAWMVSGAGVRPAGQSRPRAELPVAVKIDEATAEAAPGDRKDGAPAAGEGRSTGRPAEPGPAAGSGHPVSGDVLEHFQQVMQRFLSVQERVMLAASASAGAGSPAAAAGEQSEARSAGVEEVAYGTGDRARQAEPAPAAEPPADPAPAAAAGEQPRRDRDAVRAELMSIVSERTGYPVESLSLEADLEADLGIDSIKRVEIAGEARRLLAGREEPAPMVEELAAARTLRVLLDRLTEQGEPIPEPVPAAESPPEPAVQPAAAVERFLLRWVPAPAPARTAGLNPGGVIVVLDDGEGVGEELESQLEGLDYRVLRLPAFSLDTGPAGAGDLMQTLHASGQGVSALVDLRALNPAPVEPWEDIEPFLHLVKAAQRDLEAAASSGGAAVLAATAMGGEFGCRSLGFDAAASWRAGFLKSLAQEWPAVRMKAVDLAPTAPWVAAEQLLDELMSADGAVEVGFGAGGVRLTCKLKASAPAPVSTLPLERDSVVVVTGGARGITSECALALAEECACTLVLVGRMAIPGESEDPATASLTSEADIKRALFEQLSAEGEARPVPAQIQKRYQDLMRVREIRANLARLEGAGARAVYMQADVRDPGSLGEVIERVYEDFGRIDGFVHGAGVIEDALLQDKSPDSFESVVRTKVGVLSLLTERLRSDSLRFIVLFSSISARFGNRGQVDYAAANEILNKTAQKLDRMLPARVVAINWGPWQTTGMVSEEVRRQFLERGVGLIGLKEGRAMFLRELQNGPAGEPEVVIGAIRQAAGEHLDVEPSQFPAELPAPSESDLPLLQTGTRFERTDGGLRVHRTVALAGDWYLRDHVLDDHPVVPFAMAVELMAEAALAGFPHLEVVEIRDIRLLNGIVLTGDGYPLIVETETISDPEASRVQVAVHVRSGTASPLMLYRCEVELASSPDQASRPGPGASLTVLESEGAGGLSVEEVYRNWLFHGPLFQAIDSISGVDAGGVTAKLRTSDPTASLAGSPAGNWIVDPILVDAAFQLQVVWSRENWGITVLPSNVAALRPIRRWLDGGLAARRGLVQCQLRIREDSSAPISHSDYWFFDDEGELIGTVTDLQSIGSESLNRLPDASAAGRMRLR